MGKVTGEGTEEGRLWGETAVDKRQTGRIIFCMKHFNWNAEKNELLKQTRGLSFEEIVFLIQSGSLLAIEENPGYPDQKIYVVEIENYAVIVPFVENEAEILSLIHISEPTRPY